MHIKNDNFFSFVLWRTVSLPDDSQRKAGENPGLKLERETTLTKDELSHFVWKKLCSNEITVIKSSPYQFVKVFNRMKTDSSFNIYEYI